MSTGAASGGLSVAGMEMPSLTRDVRLPQAGAGQARPASAAPDKGISVDLKQYFDLSQADGSAIKKALESIKPDIEALVGRALEGLRSNKSRTQYAQ